MYEYMPHLRLPWLCRYSPCVIPLILALCQPLSTDALISPFRSSSHHHHRVSRSAAPETRRPGCVAPVVVTASLVRSLSVYYKGGEGFFIQEGCIDPTATAFGYLAPSVNSTGWDTLEVVTNPDDGPDDNRVTLFAAGLLEGLLTSDRIDAHSANIADALLPRNATQRALLVPKLRNWLREQASWAQNFSDGNPDDPLARSVGYLMAQLQGLINGFTIASLDAPSDPDFVLLLINAAADAFDIINVLQNYWPKWQTMSQAEFAQFVSQTSHCSALIRLLPGLEDLLLAHNTWNVYSSTLRSFKHYNIRLSNDSSFVGGRQSFSGYPGTLASLDAFYAVDNRLVLLQTTNNVFNSSLFKMVKPSSLLAWQRVRAVNQIATSGQHWAEQFSRFNSGTYNNQYMLLDLSRFRPSVSLDNGALTIIEQIPGIVRYTDQTSILRTGYWPSYNIPFHEDIYQTSGYPEVVQKFGSEYSYQMASRAKILRRDAVAIATDLDGMRWLMRSNRYRTDPFAQGDPCKCLCCRGDIPPRDSAFGCYDAKVTSSSMLRPGNTSATVPAAVWAISGPTTDDGRLEAFSWFSPPATWNVSHRLLPNIYNFSWVLMKPTLLLN